MKIQPQIGCLSSLAIQDKDMVIYYSIKNYLNPKQHLKKIATKKNLTKRIKALMTEFWLQALFWIVPFYHFNQYKARPLINWAFHAA